MSPLEWRRRQPLFMYIWTNVYTGQVVISEDVRRFVLASIPSVPYLEAALLFHGAPAARYSSADVARSLYLPESRVRELLESMCQAGVIAACPDGDGLYRFAPIDETLADAIRKLAQAYAADMIGITHLIHDSTGKNAHRFADAFKLRKDR
ncbi:MAG: hypothetical protein KF891_04090 [Rhizobacter sp.]|nr:hypothetical protein [Rhizobacter sp.]